MLPIRNIPTVITANHRHRQMMGTKLRNVMVEVGPTSEVIDLVVDEHGLTVGPYGQMAWNDLEIATEAGPTWCTLRVVTSTGIQAHFFIPGDTFSGGLSPQSFARWLEGEAAQGGATIGSSAALLA